MHWYLDVLKKYAVFSGRAQRKEFWFFVLFNGIGFIVLRIIDAAAGLSDAKSDFGLLSGLYYLAVLIPSIAVFVRRLHDTDHSGWWLGLIPLSSAIVLSVFLLAFMVREGQSGHNRFGPNPKELAASPQSVMTMTAGHIPSQTGNQMQMVFCISCGTKFPDNAAYCPRCGIRRTT